MRHKFVAKLSRTTLLLLMPTVAAAWLGPLTLSWLDDSPAVESKRPPEVIFDSDEFRAMIRAWEEDWIRDDAQPPIEIHGGII